MSTSHMNGAASSTNGHYDDVETEYLGFYEQNLERYKGWFFIH